MDALTAERLAGQEGAEALAAAAAQPDPGSVAAATAMRKRFDADLAAAALTQVVLRTRARTKFGDAAASMFFTPDGLEQATRPEVSVWRAARVRERGVETLVDLGCGIGADALAYARAGLHVVGVEADPATAVLAGANLAGIAPVQHGLAEAYDVGEAFAFCDPARRDTSGRVWRVEQLSPSWEFCSALLMRTPGACLKLGPGLPHRYVGDRRAQWISHRGDLVEACVWSGGGGVREAVLLPGDHRLVADETRVRVAPLRSYLHEPDPSVIRAGAVGRLAESTGATGVGEAIAYLSTDEAVASPWWTSFEVVEVMAYKEKVLRGWVREHRIGTLEIKKRGIEVDPAVLRRRLRPAGEGRATIVLTPTVDGAKCLVVRRLD